jgi:Na+/H+ antiporter NhaD/arsenite permease-like protein
VDRLFCHVLHQRRSRQSDDDDRHDFPDAETLGQRLSVAAMIVIAANAGGVWSVIGDVTTTMLWIGGQITPLPVVKGLFVPSLINLLLPLFVVTWRLKGKVVSPPDNRESLDSTVNPLERNLMFFLGLGLLIAVPAFKTATHLPPFMGILFGLGFSGWSVN